MEKLIVILGFIIKLSLGYPVLRNDGRMVDLTHSFSNQETVQWPSLPKFNFSELWKGTTEDGIYMEANYFSSTEHAGTHMDAPAHFAKDVWRVHEIPFERLRGPGVMIDVSEKVLKDPDYALKIDDVKDWEKMHGMIPPKAVVIMNTGRSEFYTEKNRYLGRPSEYPDTDVKHLHFPGFSPEVMEFIIKERGIVGVAIDTPSIDRGQESSFKSHQIMGKNSVWGIENIKLPKNSDGTFILPPKGFDFYNMVYKLRNGSGGPSRVFALMDDNKNNNNEPCQEHYLTCIWNHLF